MGKYKHDILLDEETEEILQGNREINRNFSQWVRGYLVAYAKNRGKRDGDAGSRK